MPESVMVLSGVFASHTTKLCNYYVFPINCSVEGINKDEKIPIIFKKFNSLQ